MRFMDEALAQGNLTEQEEQAVRHTVLQENYYLIMLSTEEQ
jgi:hypothetical protein